MEKTKYFIGIAMTNKKQRSCLFSLNALHIYLATFRKIQDRSNMNIATQKF